MVKTVILDMYGVIIEESKGRFIPFAQERRPGLSRDLIVGNFDKAGLGLIDSMAFLTALGFAPTDHDALVDEYVGAWLTLDPGFIPFARRRRDRYGFAILSNDVSHWNRRILSIHGLEGLFSQVVVSGDAGCKKPSVEIYRILLERLAQEPRDCVFVDNSVKNLDAAEQLGIRPILFNRDGESYSGTTVKSFLELEESLNLL